MKKLLNTVLCVIIILNTLGIGHSFAYSDITTKSLDQASGFLTTLGLMQGLDDDLFSPEIDITRADFALICAKMLKLDLSDNGSSIYSDVPNDHWALESINALAKIGMISGYLTVKSSA